MDCGAAWVLPAGPLLSRVFRGKFVAGLRELHATGKLGFHGGLADLAAPVAFSAMLRSLFRSDWIVYAKRPFAGAEHALRYLGCYTHRVAISNHRLVALEDREVVFRWRDSAHRNKKRLMRLALDEFLRRFFLHVLPRGFVRIRHFGFFAHRRARDVTTAMLCPAEPDGRTAHGRRGHCPGEFQIALALPAVRRSDDHCGTVYGHGRATAWAAERPETSMICSLSSPIARTRSRPHEIRVCTMQGWSDSTYAPQRDDTFANRVSSIQPLATIRKTIQNA